MAAVVYPHIEVTPRGVPYIAQHPHLNLSQIYSALAYYYDHQGEMDREIEAQLREVEQVKASLGESPVRLKLKAMGRLP